VNGRFLVTTEDNASSVCWQLDDDEGADDDEQSVWMTIRYACAANLLYVSSYALANDHWLMMWMEHQRLEPRARSLLLNCFVALQGKTTTQLLPWHAGVRWSGLLQRSLC
jgi:hypothetical protein